MIERLRTVLVTNGKYLAVGLLGAALAGGGATTVALVDSETPSPAPISREKKADPAEEKTDAAEEAAEEKADAAESETEGARPTDTHGYCVSEAVKKAHAAGKTGQDIAAAAHSCAKPHAGGKSAAAKAHAAAKKAAHKAHSQAPAKP